MREAVREPERTDNLWAGWVYVFVGRMDVLDNSNCSANCSDRNSDHVLLAMNYEMYFQLSTELSQGWDAHTSSKTERFSDR